MFGFGKKKKASDSSGQKDRQASAPSSSIKGSLISLEQRLMFDAAAGATASEVATEQVAQEQAEAAVSHDSAGSDGQTADQAESQGILEAIAAYNPGESRSEVVFVDPTVPNYQELLAGMDPHIEVVMLDGGTDGVHQMASALEGRTGLDAIHIISHGSAGELHLGSGMLSTESMLNQYARDLATIQTALSDQADILVYGCDFAKGDAGQLAVDTLAQLTGADVEASTDLTGAISLGGDWDFEVKTGSIETSLAISYDAQMNWAEVLGKESVSDTFSAKSYGNNDGTRSWASNWSEVDVGASDANGGHIKVNSGQLRIDTVAAGESVSRAVDLSGAKSATLSFNFTNDMAKSGTVEVRVSTDGGANYRTISDGVFSKTSHTGSGTASFDLSGYVSANTKIQFLVTGSSGGDRLTIDNVKVDYDVADANHAPTDITLTGSTVAENATTGTVVGTAAGSDVDAGDKLTYSLKDTAGGRFAIDATTGQITVADGSLLNAEANASHSLTVQVTDSGGLTVDKTFTIGVSNVDEGWTNLRPSEPIVTESVVDVGAGPDPVVVDPVVLEPVVDVAAGLVPVVESVSPEPVVNVTAGPIPIVEPVVLEPVVEVLAGPDPVVVDPAEPEPEPVVAVDPLMPEPVVEMGAGPEPVVEPVGDPMVVAPVVTEPVVEMTSGPDPVVVDRVVTEPVVDVAEGPDPVMDPVVTESVVKVTVGPMPAAVEMTAGPEPVVEITAGPGPVAKPVVTEQVGGAPNVNVGNVKTSGPGVEQTLVASLHQQASSGRDAISPPSSSQGPQSDFGVGRDDAANTADKMVDVQSELVVTMDSTAPSKTSSPIDQKGIAEETAVSGKGGTLFSSSGSKIGAADNLYSRETQDPDQFALGLVPWTSAEESEKVSEGSRDLAMPMLAGLVGAALQGNMRKKEKMTTMHGDIPTGEQQTANAQASQESSSDDDMEAPPRAA